MEVQVAAENIIGIAELKTAHSGKLTLFSSSNSPQISNKAVVVKRLYRKTLTRKARADREEFAKLEGRYAPADELHKLHIEANVLYWAIALQRMSDGYIQRKLDLDSALEDKQIEIPRGIRFVNAGLALVHGALAPLQTVVSASTTLRAVYLIEEPITGAIIHNADATPELTEAEEGYSLALFLACHQHIQYEKTGGLAFISDYQGIFSTIIVLMTLILIDCTTAVLGGLSLSTDPQIMSHPYVPD